MDTEKKKKKRKIIEKQRNISTIVINRDSGFQKLENSGLKTLSTS